MVVSGCRVPLSDLAKDAALRDDVEQTCQEPGEVKIQGRTAYSSPHRSLCRTPCGKP